MIISESKAFTRNRPAPQVNECNGDLSPIDESCGFRQEVGRDLFQSVQN
jgi:hypothetical protein